jgi:outer membrane protein assembly factor BamB
VTAPQLTARAQAAPQVQKPRLDLLWRAEVVSFDFWGWRPVEYSRPLAMPEQELLVVGTSHGSILAINTVTGERAWSVEAGDRVDGHPVLAQGTVLVGDNAGVLHAISAQGEPLWTFQSKGEVDGAVTVDQGRVFFQDSADHFYALDLETGEQLWTYKRDLPDYFTIGGSAQPVVYEDTVVTGFADGYVVALEADGGDVVWGRNLSNGERDFADADNTPVLHQGRLYASSYAGGLYALDPDSGEVLWRNNVRGASRPWVVDGALYITTANQLVLALDAESGQPLWRYRHLENTPTEPMVAGDYLMYGCTNSSFFVVDRHRGQVLLEFDPNVGFSAPVSVSQGVAYLLSNKGHLYAMALHQ